MYTQYIKQRLADGKEITKYYQNKIFQKASLDATVLWRRESKIDFRFFEGLFHKVDFEDKSMSIFDIYCGLGHVFDFAQHKWFKVGYYLGLDIVSEFAEHTQKKLPNRKIKNVNFADPSFDIDQHFQIVTCFGPLLHLVSHQKEYVHYIMDKTLRYTKKYALFNFVSQINPESPYFTHKDKVWGITSINEADMLDIIKKLHQDHKIDIKLHKWKIYPDATEAFIQIEVLNFEEVFIKNHLQHFAKYAIDGIEPDQIIFDTDEWDHKAARFTKPKTLDSMSTPDPKKSKWGYYIKNSTPCYPVLVEMRKHTSLISGDEWALKLRIGTPEEVEMQIKLALKKKWKRLTISNPNKKI